MFKSKLAISLVALSCAFTAQADTFVGKVTKAEVCKPNSKKCKRINTNVGADCILDIKLTGQSSGLGSQRKRNGSSSMFISGKPVGKVNIQIGDKSYKNFQGDTPYMLSPKGSALFVKKRWSGARGSLLYKKSKRSFKVMELLFRTGPVKSRRTVYTCSNF